LLLHTNIVLQTQKVRQIASTLLSLPPELSTTLLTTTDPVTGTSVTTTTPTPQTGPQPLSTTDAENCLRTFLDILVRLEGVGVTGGGPVQPTTNIINNTNTSSNINTKPSDLNITHNFLNNNIDMLNVEPTASTLLADPMVAAASYPSPNGNDAYLQAMPYAGDGVGAQEEEELRQWASFKDFQKTFMEDGGLLYST
jgi:hypothetical protein